ncbi:hypothetical protein [Solilutibacter silvestris]|nr:hypothetical protein [Lysobacter silvestris]
MIVGGVTQLLSPQPKLKKPSERADNTPSYNFSGPVNTSAQGHPVPLLYGEMIVGSAVASAGINIKDNGYAPVNSAPTGGGRAWTSADGTLNTAGAYTYGGGAA